MKAGVSRDAIKATLTGAGWQAVDVEDTLKKIEPTKVAEPISMAAASVKPAESMSASKFMNPASSANPAPQTIKMSDLVSPSATTSSPAKPITTSKSPLTGPMPVTTGPAGVKSANTYQASAFPGNKPHGSRGPLITEIILAIVIIVVGVFAGFLYMQNKSLNAQLGSLNGQSSGVDSQLSALQAQVAASTTALTAQVSSLNAETEELQMELSFYAAPSGTVPGATSTATITGVVSGGGKSLYVVTTMYGAKIYIANSKSASVIAALAPLTGTANATTTASTTSSTIPTLPITPVGPTSAQFSGTYVPGLDSMTLTAVNGTAL